MFGGAGSQTPPKDDDEAKPFDALNYAKSFDVLPEKRNRINGSPPTVDEKRTLGSSVGLKLLASARRFSFNQSPNASHRKSVSELNHQTALQKLGMHDAALSVPQGQHNNSAGESLPGHRSTFKVGVWEDRNKKCRRTMEDTHAFLYNFLNTPAPGLEEGELNENSKNYDNLEVNQVNASPETDTSSIEVMETDNGYFAIFDGHAGTFAADWCGKKLHIILEDMIRMNPNIPIPELLDLTFTNVDAQLEKLPLKNSGCTAVIAVLRWEDRIPNSQAATGSTPIAPATAATYKAVNQYSNTDEQSENNLNNSEKLSLAQNNGSLSLCEATQARLRIHATRQRVLYTANVGDARIILCRKGKALRLSYDHKGSDENEGKRVANAGGLILNNRVNGVLAVTRALGDNYMKDLVTGHPYTTETIIEPDTDEFIILACDGLWDVCSDQEAVNLVREIDDPTSAAKKLVDYALSRFSTDNLSCMIVRFNKSALITAIQKPDSAIGVEGDPTCTPGKVSEVEKIVNDVKRKAVEDGALGIAISGSNFGQGHDSEMSGGKSNEENFLEINHEILGASSSGVETDDGSISPTHVG
ncbi:Protein phosphatase 2C-like protein 1 [Erysiphe neolycopersici]|uniref:Protein phosphatase 2C-like protein 1 n=1 Tax=Erysiphe neolycopersici TaxID=212602 RepID=A0A420HRA0_9PEZI|nr:Protein phosphatase 2C-like protein 1 [Erysiphe neolycopersici]